jgi:hypothetical protein
MTAKMTGSAARRCAFRHIPDRVRGQLRAQPAWRNGVCDAIISGFGVRETLCYPDKTGGAPDM